MFGVYNTLLHMAFLLSLPLWPLGFFSKKHPYRGLSERLGLYPISTKTAVRGARPIWIHAASVGEVKSALLLIQEIKARFPGQRILLSTMTASGREVALESIPGADGVVYFPLDLPWVVSRTFRQFEPSMVVLLETEIWPNTIHAAHRIGLPVVVVSGRLSQRSGRWYRRFAGIFVRVLREISAFGMQDRESAERLLSLGVNPSRVSVTGSLKHAQPKLPDAPVGLASVSGCQSRPVVVIGSTHRGEEEIFIEVLRALRVEFPTLLLIIAPRHPERFEEVESLLQKNVVRYRKRSEPGPMDLAGAEVLLVDSLGELAWIYGWATVVFLGGTLANVGGHNLIEPGRWGKPILLGPHTSNIAETARAMLEAGGAVEIHTKDELLCQLSRLLENTELADDMGRRARAVATQDSGVLSETMGLLSKVLSQVKEI